jgi:hypothetical protein
LDVGVVEAATLDIAAIRRAEVGVVAAHPFSLTGPRDTRIARRAGVAVVALKLVRGVKAAVFPAAVVGADIPVIAGKLRRALAEAILAEVTHGAGIPIVAWLGNRSIGAASQAIAAVVRAGIFVVTIDGCPNT